MDIRKRWLEIGESVDDDRVEAALITRIHGIRGTREVNRAEGALTQDGLVLWDQELFSRHVDEDRGLLLSALSDHAEVEILQHFRADDSRTARCTDT